MIGKRKLLSTDGISKTPRLDDEESTTLVQPSVSLCNDTEAAILFLKNILQRRNISNVFPPVVFVHQVFNIIENKTTVNRQIECLRNEKKLVLIHLGADENMRVVVLFDNLKNYVLAEKDTSKKFIFEKFFDKVLSNTTDIGIPKIDLLIKHRFSEADVRMLVNAGLLILKETGVFWFSFPSAGIFMKKVLKGRQVVLQIIKKRKYGEILQTELEKRKLEKTLELPLPYLIHDLVGSKVLKSVKTTSGPLLRYVET